MKNAPPSRKKPARKKPAQAPAKTPAKAASRKGTGRDRTPLRAREKSPAPALPGKGKHGPKPYDWRPIFLKELRKTVGVVTPAAEKAGIVRSTAFLEKKTNPEFAEAWTEAVEAGVDDLERHAVALARGEATKGVYFEGELVAREPVQFERTLHKALAKHRPEWAERTELTGKGGKPLIPEKVTSFDLESMTDEELDAIRRRLDSVAAAAH